jgi:hypothetical protein
LAENRKRFDRLLSFEGLEAVEAELIVWGRNEEGNMNQLNCSISGRVCMAMAGLLVAMIAGCGSMATKTDAAKSDSTAMATMTPAASNLPTIRVKAGADAAMTDSKGVKWAADTGFDGGETVDRPDLKITGTDTPELYQSEHYSMDSFTVKVPNGKYNLMLHFSEDYDGLTSPTDRLFTYTVKDGDAASGKVIKEVKDFSPWKASGAQFKAYVDTVPVDVTSGQITVTFTAQVENPQINAIEVVPQ